MKVLKIRAIQQHWKGNVKDTLRIKVVSYVKNVRMVRGRDGLLQPLTRQFVSNNNGLFAYNRYIKKKTSTIEENKKCRSHFQIRIIKRHRMRLP